jgi:hypothetical protein
MARSLLDVKRKQAVPGRGLLAGADPVEILQGEDPPAKNRSVLQKVLSTIGSGVEGAAGAIGQTFTNPSPVQAAGLALMSGGTAVDAVSFAGQVQEKRAQAEMQAQALQSRELLASQITRASSLEDIDRILPDAMQLVAMGIPGMETLVERLTAVRSQLQTTADRERDIEFRTWVEERKSEEAALERLARGERDQAEFERRLQIQRNDHANRLQLAARAEAARMAQSPNEKPRSKAQVDAQVKADQFAASIQIMESYIGERGLPNKLTERMFNAGGALRSKVDDQTQAFLQAREAVQIHLASQLYGARVTPAAREAVIRTFLPSSGDSPQNIVGTLQSLRSFESTLREFATGGASMMDALGVLGITDADIGAEDEENPYMIGGER